MTELQLICADLWGVIMATAPDGSENDVFISDEDPVVQNVTTGAVKQILKQMESTGNPKKQPQKRSRESYGSPEESTLASKFEEVMALIKRENKSHREAMVVEMKKEFALLVTEIEAKLEAVKNRLEKRVTELESHVSERDDIVEHLRDEVVDSRQKIRKMEDIIERQEMAARAPELILSGGAVPPAPRPGAASAGPPEELRSVACDVISRAFPRVDIVPRDLADVRRIGARVLLCKFVHTGPESVRHYIYENRLTLQGKSDRSQLFVSESLTARNKEILNSLLELKKAKRLYCVFTRNGSVFFKPKKESQKVRVESMAAVAALSRDLERGGPGRRD